MNGTENISMTTNRRPWIAFFSQTGTEIYNLIKDLNVFPDCIVTNQQQTEKINKNLIDTVKFREHKLNLKNAWEFIPKNPSLRDYSNILKNFDNPIITLHGFLRIVPKKVCEKYEIYNLHPGLITKYPELKGFNPQERAFLHGHSTAGCVIHKVVPEVDEGPIVKTGQVLIEGLALPDIYKKLHDLAFLLWKRFITEDKILEK